MMMAAVMLLSLGAPATAIVCSPQTTHTFRVDPRASPAAAAAAAGPAGSPSFVDLESALSAVRVLPTPRNVTIVIASPPAGGVTLRLKKTVRIQRADSCLRLVGEADASAGCRDALAASCSTDAAKRNSPFVSPPCGVCAGKEQHDLRAAGCAAAEIQSYCSSEGMADAGAHIRADIDVPAAMVRPVSDASTLKRIQPAARGHVYEISYHELGLNHTAQWPDSCENTRNLHQNLISRGTESVLVFSDTVGEATTQTFNLFYRGKRLEFARWPKANQNMSATFPGVGCENKIGCTANCNTNDSFFWNFLLKMQR